MLQLPRKDWKLQTISTAHGLHLTLDPTPSRFECRIPKAKHNVIVILLDREDEHVVAEHDLHRVDMT